MDKKFQLIFKFIQTKTQVSFEKSLILPYYAKNVDLLLKIYDYQVFWKSKLTEKSYLLCLHQH